MSVPITYVAKGYGVDPCPGCGEKPQPDQPRTVVPGEWVPWHALCFDIKDELLCDWCDEMHAPPHDGTCLL
jgi:hypothetical protein